MRLAKRIATAAALTGLVLLSGYRLLIGGDATAAPPSSESPPSSAAVVPDDLPEHFAASTGQLILGDDRTDIEIQLPVDGPLRVQPPTFEWRFDVSDRLGEVETWGIVVADVTGATNHTTRFGQEPIAGRDPATFVASLNATESYLIGSVTATEIDGRPALETTIRLAVDDDHHLDVNGEGGILFDRPSRAWLTLVEGELIMVQVWAATDHDLAVNLPLARHMVESMRLIPT